ncbi:hypothetical protein [Bradyrhizobium sp. 141]|uniref:hypothetical protein n=1 Tax=Bradyrhizobium sp. 141 TaxID=2782617 RepID=UPI001FF75A0E|nr:hypothetical protein [Bradyrhizobium sp. 141]MCK1721252.1 hypothetical protein [Bradyrhizobium sp. 141]
MADRFSDETLRLFEASDQAIARSREVIRQRREIMAECEEALRRRELRSIFREIPELMLVPDDHLSAP